MALRHGGRILADHLAAHGVRRVFQVPGESFLAALDGLYDHEIEIVTARHEGAASMMAEATGKLTGRAGIAFVTRGPGATNAAAGVHVARQDSTPMILFVGQIDRGHRDREAFQEVDYRAMFGPLAKWVAEVDDTARLPEYVIRAFHVAQSGRPGPVVLALPEDMLSGRADVPDLAPAAPARQAIDAADVAEIDARLAAAERPLIVVGGPYWSGAAADALAAYAEARGIPVAASFRRQDRIDNRHPVYAGDLGVGMNPALGRRLAAADCLLVLGARLGDIASGGYRLLDPAAPPAILHVHPAPDLPSTVFRADLAVAAQAADMATRLAERPAGRTSGAAAEARAEYEAWQTPRPSPGALKLETVVAHLAEALPDEAIITNGAGNYAAWLHRYYRFRRFGTQLAPTSGSMGYGLPAAIAAALEHRDRPVVCLAGRRLLPDDRQRAGDGGPASGPDHRAGVQQRALRHDPDASGAQLSRPGQRHRPRQSRLRRPGAGARRGRRDGGARRRFPRRARTRTRGGGTGAHRAAARSARRCRPAPPCRRRGRRPSHHNFKKLSHDIARPAAVAYEGPCTSRAPHPPSPPSRRRRA